MSFIVAIDGPAGSGKGTVTKQVANKLGLINIDTGSTYRCVALESINQGVTLEDKEKIIEIAKTITIDIKPLPEGDKIFLKLIAEKVPFFSLKLVYDGHDGLVSAVLNGTELDLEKV